MLRTKHQEWRQEKQELLSKIRRIEVLPEVLPPENPQTAPAACSGVQVQDARRATGDASSSGPRCDEAVVPAPGCPPRARSWPRWPFFLDAGDMRKLQAASRQHYAAMDTWISELSDEQCEADDTLWYPD